jgi:uncharacterized protein YdbL (DUF1318 family)
MKKLFLSVLFVMFSLTSFSQTFVKKFTSAIAQKAGVVGEWQDVSITVVFNEKETGDIVFYYANGTTKRFHQIGDVENNTTKSGEPYQIIYCIDNSDGNDVAIQLFDDSKTLRVLLSKGYFVEFHRD